MISAVLLMVLVIPQGVWVDASGASVLKNCPTTDAPVRWLPGGCQVAEPGVWRSLAQDEANIKKRRALIAEVKVLRTALAESEKALVAANLRAAEELDRCATSQALSAAIIPTEQKCPTQWPALFVGAVGGAGLGAGLTFGLMK